MVDFAVAGTDEVPADVGRLGGGGLGAVGPLGGGGGGQQLRYRHRPGVDRGGHGPPQNTTRRLQTEQSAGW